MAIYRNIVRPIRQLSFESIIANEKFFKFAQEILCITQTDGLLRRSNPAFQNILGFPEDEIIGQSLVDFTHVDDREEVLRHITQLKLGVSCNFEVRCKRKDNSHVWLEWNAYPDDETEQVFLIARDVTERRKNEEKNRAAEYRVRQFLDNLPVAVFVVDSEGRAFYENKRSKILLGRNLNPNIGVRNLSQYYKVFVSGSDKHYPVHQLPIVRALKGESNEKSDLEIENDGSRTAVRMFGAPIYDLNNNISYAISVIDDLTEKSKKDSIISRQNKMIVEALNYALKVQNAILPDTSLLKELYPESFVFNRAKHIASGDFPLIIQNGHDIYVGAIDCTGHGVPGAFMSIAGYNMLKDLIQVRGIKDPSLILQELHLEMKKTINEDHQGYNVEDVIDVALCRLNHHEDLIEFAGARNPLFVVYSDRHFLAEAEDFSVAEDLIRHRNNRKPKFTNHKIEYEKGMTLYMFSDGFKDQFGGDTRKKFGTKRLQEMLIEIREQPMADQKKHITRAFCAMDG